MLCCADLSACLQQHAQACIDTDLPTPMQARLTDAQAELRTSEQRCHLEKGRVAELEALLSGLRAREYKADSTSQRSGSQLGAIQERNKMLEDQVGAEGGAAGDAGGMHQLGVVGSAGGPGGARGCASDDDV